jgi:(1->4)-alpha-D-glucan 1-alpha-D-glucosylmutase
MTTPRATYRLQLAPDFGFREAGEAAAYLARLGASHLYSSPVAQAAPGSEHGYDEADPARVSDDLGGPLAHAAMLEEVRRHGLGVVLDVVPNHMSVATPLNRWWWDVLRFGRASGFAGFFDIEWEAPHAAGRVLLPVLDGPLEEVIGRGELRLERRRGELRARYFDRAAPLGPASVAAILGEAGPLLAPLAEQQEELARRQRVDVAERDAADAAMAEAMGRPEPAEAVDAALRRAQGRLGETLDQQAWRLTSWRDGAQARNYRRFFEIDELVGVCVERAEVFEATHALALAAVESGAADGLRIDHPDGLRDPVGYMRRLRERAPDVWIELEKILEPGESPRKSWPIDGVTGYDFLATVSAVLTDPAGAEPLQEAWAVFAGEAWAWDDLVYTCKRLAADAMLAPEIDRVCRALGAESGAGESSDSAVDAGLREAVIEVGCALSVYRTYLRPGLDEGEEPAPEDLQFVLDACSLAGERRPDLAATIERVQASMLGGSAAGAGGEEVDLAAAAEFTLRFQQLTGVLMAKGVEDTAFYRHLRLVALNEVGGDPSQFGLGLEEFHDQMHARRTRWPRSMLASGTHDTKRSEDVRARLLALAEIPGQWRDATQRWRQAATALREAGAARINPHDEYLLHQTLVGAWPIEQSRVAAFMQKALREARARSSWTDPDTEYEQAMERFIACLYAGGELLAEIATFAAQITAPGRINSLSQTLLKLTCPGVPDIYQGCELWDLSLVDPDNRRPVDFALRRRLLDELDRLEPAKIWQRMDEGLPKLWLIRQALALRARRPELLDGAAAYTAMSAVGVRAECCIAFMRDEGMIAIASRFPARLEAGRGWGATVLELPAGEWVDVLGGGRWAQGNHALNDLLRMAPVALLERL